MLYLCNRIKFIDILQKEIRNSAAAHAVRPPPERAAQAGRVFQRFFRTQCPVNAVHPCQQGHGTNTIFAALAGLFRPACAQCYIFFINLSKFSIIMSTNTSTSTSTEKKTSARAIYCRVLDANVRSFSSYLAEVRKDADALNAAALAAAAKEADKAAKDARKTAKAEKAAKDAAMKAEKAAKDAAARAERAAERAANPAIAARLNAARETLDGARLNASDITPAFIREWLPLSIMEDGRICDIKKVKLEDEMKVREMYADAPEYLREIGGFLCILNPAPLWTASKVITKFAKAAKARRDAEKAARDAASAAERAAKEKAREDAILARAAAIQAKRKAAKK